MLRPFNVWELWELSICFLTIIRFENYESFQYASKLSLGDYSAWLLFRIRELSVALPRYSLYLALFLYVSVANETQLLGKNRTCEIWTGKIFNYSTCNCTPCTIQCCTIWYSQWNSAQQRNHQCFDLLLWIWTAAVTMAVWGGVDWVEVLVVQL